MSDLRTRAAVSPLRRRFAAFPTRLPTVDAVIAAERPEDPMHCLRPATVAATARAFIEAFPGDVLYAVKCNPDPAMLRAVAAGGVTHFDCASLPELRLVRQMFPDADLHFMHPIKARTAIREAWAELGVRDFVLDSAEELAKLQAEIAATGVPGRPGLIVRLALPKGDAKLDLSGKFGAAPDLAVALLRAARPLAARLGVSFHVGSQCLDPLAWRHALALAGDVIRAAGVAIEIVDIGGGFPVAYPDQDPPPLGAFMAEIEEGFERLDLPDARLWAEPGRALVAGGASVVVQVQHRRGDALYINDGVYGSLADAGVLGFRYPVRLVRPDGTSSSDRTAAAASSEDAGDATRFERADGATRSEHTDRTAPSAPVDRAALAGDSVAFSLFGPTCDSADVMRGPFVLPADIREGDWIEIGQLGAYGACMRTAFNGFDRARIVEVSDRPMLETAGYAPIVIRLAA